MAAVSNVPELSSYTMNFEQRWLDGLNGASRLNGLNRFRLFVSAAVEQLERLELIADSSGE